VCHADLEHGKIEALGWTMSYLPNGTAIAQVETRTSDATGTYLCLTFAFSSAIQRDYHNHVVDQAINSLRIVLGVTVARNCVSTAFYSLYEPEPRTLSDTGYHSYFDSMELNLFRDPPIETGNVPRLPKEAALILSIAFDQKLPREQFFFLDRKSV